MKFKLGKEENQLNL